MKRTLEHIARGQYRKALVRALAGAEEAPMDPRRQAVLLLALTKARPEAFPVPQASQLLEAFIRATDIGGALGVLGTFREAGYMPDPSLLRSFLDTFANPGEGMPPAGGEIPEYPEGEAAPEEELVSRALHILENNPVPQPPPSPPRDVPLFRALDEEEMATLLEESSLRFHREGDYVIREGDDSDSLYVLIHGQLKVLKGGDSDKYLLGRLRPGSFFGEMALVTSGPRTASVKAEEPSVTLRIPSSVFEKLVVHNPELARELTTYTRVRLLKNLMVISPLFRPIPAEKRPEVIQSFRAKVYEPGDLIVRQGKPSPGLFMVASGEVYIEREQEGERVRLATLGAGEVFGEMSLIRGGDATADVVAGEDGAVVMFLSREKFNELSTTVPELLSQVFQTTLLRTDMNKAIEEQESEEPVI